MSVSNTTPVVSYEGNGVTTEWSVPFDFISTDDIQLFVTDPDGITTEITEDFDVDVANSLVEYPTVASSLDPLEADYELEIRRTQAITQELSLRTTGSFNPRTIERALDKLTMIDQELDLRLDESEIPLADHIADTAGAHAASAISFTTSGALSGGTVQAALAQVEARLHVDYSATVANGQGSATSLTGMLFSNLTCRSVTATVEVRRKTSSAEAIATGVLRLIYRELTSAWAIAGLQLDGDDTGLTLTVTSAGQLQYVSSTLSGSSYSGTFKMKVLSFA
jgi:hypothetical protein